uniref:hypothetical protein n=1 Tax=Ulva meridionalis TaxID=434723 RepID=UPI0028E0A397|nr:hypothetical protein NQY40_pgp029 [Ulva meridionalis]WFS80082.1 hypothetical protein [Ulva meridionalis]
MNDKIDQIEKNLKTVLFLLKEISSAARLAKYNTNRYLNKEEQSSESDLSDETAVNYEQHFDPLSDDIYNDVKIKKHFNKLINVFEKLDEDINSIYCVVDQSVTTKNLKILLKDLLKDLLKYYYNNEKFNSED